jgi:type II secretory pathway component PulF
MAEGQLDAGGRHEALRQIETLGLRPVALAEAAAKHTTAKSTNGALSSKSLQWRGSGKISSYALENFTRLLSSLLAAGVPLCRAIVILTREASSGAAAAKWKEIYDSVVDGRRSPIPWLSRPRSSPVYIAMVQAGETGGFLTLCWRRSPISVP